MRWTARREPYVEIITALLSDEITGSDFCARFLDLWRSDRDGHRWTSSTIDRLMTAVDCFEEEPEPRSPFEIGLAGLKDEARLALASLRR